MKYTDYCSKCKKKNIPLVKYASNKTTQYHYCRNCTNDKFKKYYSTEIGKKNIKQNSAKTYQKYKNKQSARAIVNRAIALGDIIKPSTCIECGNNGSRIEGHHNDYNLPLVVDWLCSSCHANRHKLNFVL